MQLPSLKRLLSLQAVNRGEAYRDVRSRITTTVYDHVYRRSKYRSSWRPLADLRRNLAVQVYARIAKKN